MTFSDDELWAEVEAKEVRLWVNLAETGLWCPVCNLPSGIRITVNCDPNDPDVPGAGKTVCTEDKNHRVPMEAA